MDDFFGPLEWSGMLTVCFDESINGLAHLARRCETRTAQGLTPEYREPDLDHVQPGSVCRREVKAHVRMPRKPAVVLQLVGSSKGTADGLSSLDVNWLKREGILTPGRRSSVSWSRGDRPAGDIAIRAETGRVVLVYRSRSYGEEWEDVEEPVRLTWTPCNYGGERPWFVCPGARCGRRVGKLYAAGK